MGCRTLPANVFPVDPALSAELLAWSRHLRAPALVGNALSRHVLQEYRDALHSLPTIESLIRRLRADLRTAPSARGYLVLDGLFCSQLSIDEDLVLPTALCALVGHPFRVFTRWDLWLPVAVDLNTAPQRFGGVGYNPFHIDVVNSERRPAHFSFFCVRRDPAGGGQTILSNLHRALDALTCKEREYLSRPIFREGQFYALSGVGRERNPFPIIEDLPDGVPRIRFTAKMLPELTADIDARPLQKLNRILTEQQELFELMPGQLLIVNQRVLAHGRLALGPNQQCVPENARRLLWQLYIDDRSWTTSV